MCKLDLAAVKEVKWAKGISQLAQDCSFFCENRNANHHLGAGLFVH
jgi:hypothetical protein